VREGEGGREGGRGGGREGGSKGLPRAGDGQVVIERVAEGSGVRKGQGDQSQPLEGELGGPA